MHASRCIAALALATMLAGCADWIGCTSAQCAEDAHLREQVLDQINRRPSLSVFNIDVQAHDHAVYLWGLVDGEIDRARAEQIASAVPGVRKVYNGLSIGGNIY